jgi:hypothetical protein
MKKKKFSTSHGLKFHCFETSPIKGFTSFALGGVSGYFAQNNMSVDFVIAEMENPDHLIDSVEWFSEMGKESGIPIRVLSCNPENPIFNRLISDFGFIQSHPTTLLKA